MPSSKLSRFDFIKMFEEVGPHQMQVRAGMDLRSIYRRRRAIERELGITLKAKDGAAQQHEPRFPQRVQLFVDNGCVIIAGDAHYWPGEPSLMHRALVHLCKQLKPAIVIFNGDVIDAPTVSRHMPIGWEQRPKLSDEIDAARERLHEIALAAFKARKVWLLGNHDARYETRLAHVAPEYAKIHGVHLKDHFPDWETGWSAWINDDVVVKHRFKGGIHATHNNTMWAGKTIVTGHLHSAQVRPFSDYNGTRYGVDAGCIADVDHKAFVDYTEDNPKNWRSAFCVLEFHEGRLKEPALCLKWDETKVQFRGEIIEP